MNKKADGNIVVLLIQKASDRVGERRKKRETKKKSRNAQAAGREESDWVDGLLLRLPSGRHDNTQTEHTQSSGKAGLP